ncbi:MAG: arabinogalactan endo-1,4-beta-galactosidase, partial [Lachnospiraceae bacterium]|nr:arabinogalactan endo-1,4-beta-galactosidase [Lachnospiraceae bacterium]
MEEVEGHSGWFNITFTVNDTIVINSNNVSCHTSFSIFSSKNTDKPLIACDKYPNLYIDLLEGNITAIKDTDGVPVGYASIEEAEEATKVPEEPDKPDEPREWTFEELEDLIAEVENYYEDDYTTASWNTFSKALDAAKKITKEASKEEIMAAYEALGIAKNVLVAGSVRVEQIELSDGFITGADLSSYLSLKNSGVIFKDEEGNELNDAAFFKYLRDGGTNWVRIRIWNDPFDSNKNGYGGGNNDLEVAKKIGKWATDAGMRVLIDFHYSDFWADPGKQKEPKAWAGYTVEQKAIAVKTFTKDSLDALKKAGVDVGMVQVGNETTNSICGVSLSDWTNSSKIFNAGSQAVREFDENCLVAIHFTNPERAGNYANFAKNLNDKNVDYDVFASSYYPFWHGTTENLTTQLADIAKTYNKKVMVAETSWATTLDNQDGHDNTVRRGNNDKNPAYNISVQGQADELSAVVKAVNDVNQTASGNG